jgi:chromosome segregation ATPase
MKQKGSSIKNCDLRGMPSNQIVEKYEKVLESRENQLSELSSEVGNMNEKLLLYSEKCTKLEEENKSLHLKILKKSQTLKQELNNKEIMFHKLKEKENEFEKRKKKYDKLLQIFQSAKIEIKKNKLNISQEKKNPETNSIEESFEKKEFTTSVKDKIKNITAKTGSNMKKLNFLELINEKK